MENFEKYLDQLINAIQTYGPQATNLALEVGRIGAMQEVIPNLIFTLVCSVIAYVASRMCFQNMQYVGSNPHSYCDDREAYHKWEKAETTGFGKMMVSGSVSFLAALAALLNFAQTLNFYAWAGIFRPEVWLVAKALKL
jgi:hypothetical protein